MVYLFHSNDLRGLGKYNVLPWARLACASDVRAERVAEQHRFSIAKELQKETDKARRNFVDFVGQLSEQQPDKVLWYSSRLASKSVSQTDIFHQYVYLKVLENLAHREEKQVIITDNARLYQHAYQLGLAHVKLCSRPSQTGYRPAPAWRGALKCLRYTLLWMMLRSRGRPEIPETDCLVHLWIDNRIFQQDPDTHDPYFGDLVRKLRERGMRIERIGPVSLRFSDVPRLKKTYPGVVLPLAHVGWTQLWDSFTTRFSVRIIEEEFRRIRDLPLLVYLTRYEVEKERRSRGHVPYLLYYHGYKAIAQASKAGVVYPYENQPWEKMLHMACPEWRRVGYQHSTIPVNWLDYYCSDYETAEPRPDVVLTAGPRWSDFIRSSNKHVKVAEAGTFRYRYLLDKDSKGKPAERSRDILIALPLDPLSALRLQEQLFRVLENDRFKKYRFLVKPHPHLAERFVKGQRMGAYSHCEVVRTPVSEILSACELCITVDSTVALEAVLSGVKTISYLPEDVTQGMEYLVRDDAYTASESDFVDVFTEALESMQYPAVDIHRFFSAVRYQTFEEQIDTGSTKEKAQAL